MTAPVPPSGQLRAARLREEFDRSFAAPPSPVRPQEEPLLLVSVAGLGCALALHECAGVTRATGVTRLPAREPGFVGVTSLHGAVAAVYDLAPRIDGGLPTRPDRRWLIAAAGSERIAFLVDTVDGYAARELQENADPAALVTVEGMPRRYVSLGAVVRALSQGLRRSRGQATRSVR